MRFTEFLLESSTGRVREHKGSTTYQDLLQYPLVDYIVHYNYDGDKSLMWARPVPGTGRVVWSVIKPEKAPKHIQFLYMVYP